MDKRRMAELQREVAMIRTTSANVCRLWTKWSCQPDPPDMPPGGPAILFIWGASWGPEEYIEPEEPNVLDIPTLATEADLEAMQRVADAPPEVGVLRHPFRLAGPPHGDLVFANEADREAFRAAGLL